MTITSCATCNALCKSKRDKKLMADLANAVVIVTGEAVAFVVFMICEQNKYGMFTFKAQPTLAIALTRFYIKALSISFSLSCR